MKIIDPEKKPDAENDTELQHLNETFILVVCDYQQSKLIPYWGESSRPGMTYYLQKMSYDVFDCRNDQEYVYLVPETIGPRTQTIR